MSKLKKERINQLIENSLFYEQESSRFNSDFLYKRLKGFILKPKLYGTTFASWILVCVFIPPIITSRNLVNVSQINDYVTLSIIDEFWIRRRANDAPLFSRQLVLSMLRLNNIIPIHLKY